MPRRPRLDTPGCTHHVLSRGEDKRPLFTWRRDYRFFLCLLALAVRAGRIRVHAFCLMKNHFHLLLESLDGNLSKTMWWLKFRYAAYFNATREHTDHVFGGRFHSFPVLCLAYLHTLIRYIDRNPLEAGIWSDPLTSAFGSARLHVTADPGTRWLARNVVDAFLAPALDSGDERPVAYRSAFRLGEDAGSARRLIETRNLHPSRGADDLDELLAAGMEASLAWLRRRARATEGTRPGLPMTDPTSVLEAVQRAQVRAPLATLPARRGQSRSLWRIVQAGLLRDLGGAGYATIGRIVGTSDTTARKRYAVYREVLHSDDAYGLPFTSVARDALRLCFGPQLVP